MYLPIQTSLANDVELADASIGGGATSPLGKVRENFQKVTRERKRDVE